MYIHALVLLTVTSYNTRSSGWLFDGQVTSRSGWCTGRSVWTWRWSEPEGLWENKATRTRRVKILQSCYTQYFTVHFMYCVQADFSIKGLSQIRSCKQKYLIMWSNRANCFFTQVNRSHWVFTETVQRPGMKHEFNTSRITQLSGFTNLNNGWRQAAFTARQVRQSTGTQLAHDIIIIMAR